MVIFTKKNIKKRLVILADALDNQRAGVHVYTRELLNALHLKHEMLLFEVILIREQENKEYPNFSTIALKANKFIGASSLRKFVRIPVLLRKLGADMVLETTNFGPFFTPTYSKSVTVIHDLTPVLFPNWHTFNGWFWQKLLLGKIINTSDLILTVSQNTLRDIIDLYDTDQNKICPIHLGVSEKYGYTIDENILTKFDIDQEYFLSVGTIEPRKNHQLILKAFGQILDEKKLLVLVGDIGWKSNEIIQMIKLHPKKDRIILTGYVTEYEKNVLLSSCIAMIYASHYEGFGLPVIENGACANISFVAYNSSLKELANPLTKYFDTEDDLIGLMDHYVKPNIEERLIQAKLLKEQFSWERYLSTFVSTIEQKFSKNYGVLSGSKCAIAILNWNGLKDTIECIESLLKGNLDDCEIYLMDNCSDNNEGSILYERYAEHPNITIVLFTENLGFTGAHNKLWIDFLEQLDFEHLILLNNDTTVDVNAIQALRHSAKEQQLSIASSKMIDYFDHELIDSIGHMLYLNGEILPKGHKKSVHSQKQFNQSVGGSGGGVLYSTQLIHEIGFFDSFFDTGYEDAEFGLRTFMAEHKIGFCSDAIIYHKGGASIKKIFNHHYAIRTQLNTLYTVFKLFPPMLLGISLIIIIIRLLFISIAGLLINRREISLVLIKSHFQFFNTHLKKAIDARRKFKPRRKLNSLNLFMVCHSNVRYDFVRLRNIFIYKNPSAVTQYR